MRDTHTWWNILNIKGIPKEIDKDFLLNIIKEKKVPVIIPMGIGNDKKIYNSIRWWWWSKIYINIYLN